MKQILHPDLYLNSLLDVPLEKLRQQGKRTLLLDLDNTITEWNSDKVNVEIVNWFSIVQEKGFKACILSNNGKKRIASVASQLNIPFVYKAKKPLRRSFRYALNLLDAQAGEAVIIGDQIFTDILGGNRAGLFTILVKPLASKEFMGTKISRFFESFVLKNYKR